MDPLSDVLSLLQPRSYTSGGFELRRSMAIQWPEHEGIKCYAIVSGQCWLSLEGVSDAVLLTAGECYLLPPGPPFRLATDLSLDPVDFTVMRDAWRAEFRSISGEEGSCHLVGGHFILAGSHADILLSSLPPIVHLRKDSDKAAMRWSLERLQEELRDPQPGGSLIAQATRLHDARSGSSASPGGWCPGAASAGSLRLRIDK